MVDVPYIAAETLADAHHQVPVYHLAAGEEALHDPVGNLPGFDVPDLDAGDMAVEIYLVLENLLHGIDPGAHENVAAPSGVAFRQGCLEYLQDLFPIFQQGDVLEFGKHHHEVLALRFRDPVGKGEYRADVILVQVPAQRQDGARGGILGRIEDEMRVLKEHSGKLCEFVGGGGFGPDDSGAKGQQELLRTPYVQEGQLRTGKLLPGDAHVEEGLLYQRGLSGLGRFVYHHVLSLGQQVGKQCLLAPAPEIVLAGDVFIVNEGGIHYVTKMFVRQK